MRADIGSAAENLAQACFGGIAVGDSRFAPYACDGILLNGYLGGDSVRPFTQFCANGKNVFLIARSSNKSAREVQDLIAGDRLVYQVIADLAMRWSIDLFGKNGYSEIGLAVGATNPRVLQRLREKYDRLFFLVPGYGAQGGRAADAAAAFDKFGHGAIVMTFLTDVAGFAVGIAAAINSVFSIIDACLSWIYGGILNGTKAKKWGRYRSWLILTPWIVPFIFAFQFVRLGDNEILSAVIIVIAAVVSHVIWNIGYVANATLVNVVGNTPDEKATLASSRATWNNIGGLLFSYLGLPLATLLGGFIGEKNMYAGAAFCLGILMVAGYFAHFKMTEGYELAEQPDAPKSVKKKITVREMFASLFKNPQLIILMTTTMSAKNAERRYFYE